MRPLERIRRHRDEFGCERALDLALGEIVRLTDLITLLLPHDVASAAVTIPNTERNTTSMAFELRDDDTTHHAEVSYFKADGSPAAVPAGVTVEFSSSNTDLLTVDASGTLTPVADGALAVGAVITLPDGSTLTATPADVDVIAVPPASATVTIV